MFLYFYKKTFKMFLHLW